MFHQRLKSIPVRHDQIPERVNGDCLINYAFLDEFSNQLVNVAKVSSLKIFQAIVKAFPVHLTVLLHSIMHILPATCKRLFRDFFENRKGHIRLCLEVCRLDETRILPELKNNKDGAEDNCDRADCAEKTDQRRKVDHG